MNDKETIIEYFAKDYPTATITNIESMGAIPREHYYEVTGKSENGEFETRVFVDGPQVLILPTTGIKR
jgi:hypothetical protein